jgi:preprotein translocase subunit SecD
MNVRDNWRILLLVVLVAISAIALFAPTGSGAPASNNTTAVTGDDPTNLQYGLELSGGTRLRAQLQGVTAEDVGVTADNPREIRTTVADELGIEQINVEVRRTTETAGTVEVFANVSESAFADALNAAGLDVSTDQIRSGVTQDTMSTAQETLDDRINRGGLTGGGASIVRSATGQDFIVIEVPGANRSQVSEFLDRGSIQIVAGYPVQTDNGTEYRSQPVLEQGDFTNISPARQASQGVADHVQVSLKDDPAESFVSVMNDNDFTTSGVSNCQWRTNPEDPGYCLYTVVDGKRVYGAGLSPDLASSIQDRTDFLNNPTFLMQTSNYSAAQELKINLESGALPTELDIQSEMYLAPSLAQEFKPFALITGLIAWFAVSGAVFYRYREVRVAIPMLVTAAAEVFILLGFAAAIGLALDLSHIAGFIAVIGTGVDDLVIIADEILQRGEIKTGRVFQNRFRKAFWVIGAAAATTIIAMSPLAILSLGDLQGFAIVTIVGVLIGVLITRPAYGDVLRNLLLEDV